MIRILLAIYVTCRHDAYLTIFLTISLRIVHNNASIIYIYIYIYNINSIVDNLTKQNSMYSFVVIYKVKLRMHALDIFMILCRI